MQGDSEPTTLSEGERRILASIEAELDLRDPGFAARYRRRLEAGRGRLTLSPQVELAARRLGGFLGWWVDPSGGGRGPGLRDNAP